MCMWKPKNLIGVKFGRLTVIEYIKGGKWICQCECGNKHIAATGDLNKNKVNSCGCYKSEYVKNKNYTHKLRNHRLYSIYHNMKSRCYNPNSTYYKYYGKRGVLICKDWLNDEGGFVNFYNWSIDNGYDESLTIDRIDVNGDYTPDNCRWVTRGVQMNNTNNNHYIVINGETKTLQEWSIVYNISDKTIRGRISIGWDDVKAVVTPIDVSRGRKNK